MLILPRFTAGSPKKPGVGSVGVFGRLRGEGTVDLTGLGEAKAMESHGIRIILRVEIHRSHGNTGPVTRCNFKPIGKVKWCQSHAPDGDCIATSVTDNLTRPCCLLASVGVKREDSLIKLSSRGRP